MESGPDSFRDHLLARATRASVHLEQAHIDALHRYVSLLSHWNKRINLTSLPLNPLSDQAIDRLLVEPLAAVKYVGEQSLDWLDLGSGGGSPAIPLKILRPAATLTMVESRSRKAAFLREAARELSLENVDVWAKRFDEILEGLPGQCVDLVTARAVRLDRTVQRLVSEVLKRKGRFVLFDSATSERYDLQGLRLSETVELSLGTSRLFIFERST